jgi:hypothetical protein
MNRPAKLPANLIGLAARRFLSPAALALTTAALALAAFLPFSPSAARGANELSPEVGAGLARQGVWLTALAVVLPWFCARAAWCVGRWRRGEGDWLGTGVLSRANVALGHMLGAFLALALVLAPFAIAAELRAGAVAPRLRWIADERVEPVVLLTEADRVQRSVHPPRGGDVLLGRFVIAAPGNGGPSAKLRCAVSRSGAQDFFVDVLATANTPFEIELQNGTGPVELVFQRVGAGAVAALDDSRLQWFQARPARWSNALAQFLHAWLACSVACAIALGVAAWTSAGTALLCGLGVLAVAALGEKLPLAWPGVGLCDALQLCSDGLGPADPAPATWLGAALACLVSVSLPALQRDLWRRDA